MKSLFLKLSAGCVGATLLAFSASAFSQQAAVMRADHWRYDAAVKSDMEKNIDTFFGPFRGRYLPSGGLISGQFKDVVLSIGQPDEPQADGGMLVSGFKVHDAANRAALLLDAQGNIKSAALIHFGCHPEPVADPAQNGDKTTRIVCASHDSPILTIFSPLYVPSDPSIAIFRAWAVRQGKATKDLYSKGSVKFKVQVVQLTKKN